MGAAGGKQLLARRRQDEKRVERPSATKSLTLMDVGNARAAVEQLAFLRSARLVRRHPDLVRHDRLVLPALAPLDLLVHLHMQDGPRCTSDEY